MPIFEWSFYTRLTECKFEVSAQAKPFCVTITAESRVKTWLVLCYSTLCHFKVLQFISKAERKSCLRYFCCFLVFVSVPSFVSGLVPCLTAR